MISERNKARARGHLGYLQVQESATFQLGIPAATQTQFTIELAFTKVLASAEAELNTLLDRLDQIECQIVENTENVELSELGDLKFRTDAFKQVMIRYTYWQGKLANLLGIVPNPFDQRPFFTAGGGLNVPVIN
jgi:hypothetical protein